MSALHINTDEEFLMLPYYVQKYKQTGRDFEWQW